MNVIKTPALRWPSRRELSDVGIWVVLTLVLGLLPLTGGMAIRILWQKPFAFADFVIHGEFALYTASIVSGTLYIVCREFQTNFPLRPWFVTFTVLLALWASLISGGIFLGDNAPPSATLMAFATVPTFVVAMLLAVAAMLLERQLPLTDPHALADLQQEDLAKKVRKRRKKPEEPKTETKSKDSDAGKKTDGENGGK
jgi:hypothetical protein